MSKEGLTAQDRRTGADAGMIIAKNILGSIKEDALFFARELFTDADPFHCSTSAGKGLSNAVRYRQIEAKEYRTMLARAVPKIKVWTNPLIFPEKSPEGPSSAAEKGYVVSYSCTENHG